MFKKVYIASDHAGFDLKNTVKKYLEKSNIQHEDCGTNDGNTSCHYPEYAKKALDKLTESKTQDKECVLLICHTGIGMSITANRRSNIRAALCNDEYSAKMTRLHNNANCLCLSQRILLNNEDLLKKILDNFLSTEFEGGRHQARLDMIN